MDNSINFVTQRKQKRPFENDLNLSEIVIYNQSMPILGGYDHEIKDLKEEIFTLKLQLETADKEIENYGLENNCLRKTLQEYEKKIKINKSVGVENVQPENSLIAKFYSPRYRNLSLRHTKIGYPRTSLNQLTDNVVRHLSSTFMNSTANCKTITKDNESSIIQPRILKDQEKKSTATTDRLMNSECPKSNILKDKEIYVN